MPKSLALLAAGTAFLAAPALAQLDAGGVANVNLVGQLGGNPGNTAAGAVGGIDGAAKKAVDTANLTVATREQVRAGAEIYDTSGNSVGTVQSIDGGTAIVVRGGKLYNVPLSEIYHNAADRAHALVTKLSRAEITPRASIGAAAGSQVQTR